MGSENFQVKELLLATVWGNSTRKFLPKEDRKIYKRVNIKQTKGENQHCSPFKLPVFKIFNLDINSCPRTYGKYLFPQSSQGNSEDLLSPEHVEGFVGVTEDLREPTSIQEL